MVKSCNKYSTYILIHAFLSITFSEIDLRQIVWINRKPEKILFLLNNKMKPLINIIGAGRLGKTIARLITVHQAGTIQGVYNTTLESTKKAVQFIGQGKPFLSIESLPPVDMTIISTPDDQIAPCCKKLSLSNNLKKKSIIIHCSGSLSSEILFSVVKNGCFTASAHPMRSFAVPESAFLNYNGTYCALEGHRKIIPLLDNIFSIIGSITFLINSEKKAIYHTGNVFASNYLITTASAAFRCLKKAGIEDILAFKMIIKLMKSTLNNLETTLSFEKALTGPLKRGDVNTILKHLNALLHEKELTALYKALALLTIEIS